MSSPYIYRAEVKGIQAWILASDKLKELKGGSAVIDALAEDAQTLLQRTQGTVIANAAGAIEASFPTIDALQRFAAAWPLIVELRAPGLSLIHAWVSAREDRKLLYQRLGEDRNRIPVMLPEAGPLLSRVGRTGQPAIKSGEDGLEDRAMVQKRRHTSLRATSPLRDIQPEGWAFVADHNALGDRYLAVIHADGNRIGQQIMELKTDKERRDFSDDLSAITIQAAKTAIAMCARWQEINDDKSGELRLRPVVVGGDDFTVLVDARYALALTHTYLTSFSQEASKRKRTLSASAGIALVKTGWPFHAAHALAESLCKAAKDKFRVEVLPPAALLFHRVTTASSDTDWSDLKAGELRSHDGGKLLSGGPYTLERLEQLCRVAKVMRALPRGAVREWLRWVRTDASRAEAHWLRVREVAKPDVWSAFSREMEAMGQNAKTGWSQDGTQTVLGDALLWRTLDPGLTSTLSIGGRA